MVVLLVISFAIFVWGFIQGWAKNDGFAADVLLDWAYAMVVIAVLAVIGVGLAIGIINNPKMLVKLGIGIVAVVVLCAIAYFLASGDPINSLTAVKTTPEELKFTDTILNLAYITGAGAILAIIAGEIRLAITDKK